MGEKVDFSAYRTRNVTVFTDASFCQQTHAAGGAFWARTQTEYAQGSFPLAECHQSHEAEVLTVAHALSLILGGESNIKVENTNDWLVIIVADCHGVKGAFSGKMPGNMSERTENYVCDVIAKMQSLGIRWKVNHVKGHSGVKDARSWVNRWCDKHAKNEMLVERAFKLTAGVLK